MQTITGHVSIKNIFKDKRIKFVKIHGPLIRDICFESVNKVLLCSDPQNGFATFHCDSCHDVKHIPFSCKSRFCNSCGTPQSDLWMSKLLSRRPSSLQYYHLVFTIPPELRPFFKSHRRALSLLPKAASSVLFYFFRTKHKSKPGILSVIHTFGAKLNWIPHVHCVFTSGGFTNSDQFVPISFIPYKLIITSWKKTLLRELKIRIKQHCSDPHPHLKLVNSLYSQTDSNHNLKSRYVFFSKKATSFRIVVSYIGRYLKRPTISQSRILNYDGESVTFQYKDKYDNQDKTITCSALDFIAYLIQHIPNKNFHMIYYHGIFANRCKARYLKLLTYYFPPTSKLPVIASSYSQRKFFLTGINPLVCPCSGHFRLFSISIPGYPIKYFDSG